MSQVAGLLTMNIISGRNLGGEKGRNKADPYVWVTVGKTEIIETPVIGNTNLPVWEHTETVYVNGKVLPSTMYTVQVYDKGLPLLDSHMGECYISVAELAQKGQIEQNFNLVAKATKVTKDDSDGEEIIEEPRGTLKLKASFQPLAPGSPIPEGTKMYDIENFHNPPVETPIDFHIERARDLNNKDGFGGKSDPYVTVKIGKTTLTKTPVIGNTTLPVWEHRDSIILKGTMMDDTIMQIKVKDEDTVSSDDIGWINVPVYSFLQKGSMAGTFPLEVPEKDKKQGTLTINFSVPAMAKSGAKIVDVGDLQMKEWKKQGKKGALEGATYLGKAKGSTVVESSSVSAAAADMGTRGIDMGSRSMDPFTVKVDALFDKYNANKDGDLTGKEFKACISKELGLNVEGKQGLKYVIEANKDGAGNISRDEFREWCLKHKADFAKIPGFDINMPNDQFSLQMDAMYNKYNLDGDGNMTGKEFQKFLSDGLGWDISGKKGLQYTVEANADGSGNITKPEFMGFCNKYKSKIMASLPSFNGGSINGSSINMPGFSAGAATGAAIGMNMPSMKGGSIDVDAPDLNMRAMNVDAPDFKAPEIKMGDMPNVNAKASGGWGGFGFKKPEFNAPEIDMPDMPDMKAPEMKGFSVDAPDMDIKGPKVDMPDVDIKGPKVDMPDVDAKASGGWGGFGFKKPEFNAPEIDMPDMPDVDLKAPKMDMPDFKGPNIDMPDMPDVDMKAPKMDMPDIDAPEINIKGLSMDAPEIKGQTVKVDGKDFTMPKAAGFAKWGLSKPDIDGPSVEIGDIKAPEMKGFDMKAPKMNMPDVPDMKMEGGSLDMPDMTTGGGKFSMPGVNGGSLDMPNMKMEGGSLDMPDINTSDMPDINIRGAGIDMPNVKGGSMSMKPPSLGALAVAFPSLSFAAPKVDKPVAAFAVMRNSHEAFRASRAKEISPLVEYLVTTPITESKALQAQRERIWGLLTDKFHYHKKNAQVHRDMEDHNLFPLLSEIDSGKMNAAGFDDQHAKYDLALKKMSNIMKAKKGNLKKEEELIPKLDTMWKKFIKIEDAHFKEEEQVMMALTQKTGKTPEERAQVMCKRVLTPSLEREGENLVKYFKWCAQQLGKHGESDKEGDRAETATNFIRALHVSSTPEQWVAGFMNSMRDAVGSEFWDELCKNYDLDKPSPINA